MFVFTSVMERSSRLCRGLVQFMVGLLILSFINSSGYYYSKIIYHYQSLFFSVVYYYISSCRDGSNGGDGGDVSGGYQEGVVGNRQLPVIIFSFHVFLNLYISVWLSFVMTYFIDQPLLLIVTLLIQ